MQSKITTHLISSHLKSNPLFHHVMAANPSVREMAPKIVSYKYSADLATLKSWFYSFDKKDNRQRAVDRVKSFQSRGKLPHAVECTALFTSLILSDPNTSTRNVKQYDSNMLQLSYSMALIRFVNGLLDPFQQGSYAISLHHLARNLGLPSFFVEVRHMGTHEQLPNLDILRIATGRAINWLFDHYWTTIDDTTETVLTTEKKIVNIASKIETNLKTYKKIRKLDLDRAYDKNDDTDSGLKYWKAVQKLRQLLTSNEEFISILLKNNYLIYNKIDPEDSKKKLKFNNLLTKLYKPLLDECGPKFKVRLFHALLEFVDGNTSEFESVQAQEWIKYVISDLLLLPKYDFNYEDLSIVTTKDELCTLLISVISQVSVSQQRRSLSIIEAHIDPNVSSDIVSRIAELKRQAKLSSFAKVPSLDDILGLDPVDTAPPAKKAKTTNNGFVFEEHLYWEPRPFGVC